MVELIVNGQVVDLERGNNIKFTRQVADLLDVTSVVSSYTNSFNIPKTPRNAQILEQLGMVGNTSTTPYSLVDAEIRLYGVRIALGKLSIKETGNDYKASVIDGMIDFFKAIENKTLGKDLNLSEFNHEKTFATIISSFTNEYYRYIVADFNGQQMIQDEDGMSINIDYLAPAFNMYKLLVAAIEQNGYTLVDENLDFIKNKWITYPKDPSETITDDLYARLYRGLFVSSSMNKNQGLPYWTSTQLYPWTNIDTPEGVMMGNEYVIPEDGVYRIDVAVQAYMELDSPLTNPVYNPVNYDVFINGQSANGIQTTDPETEATGSFSLQLNAGDKVGARLYYTGNPHPAFMKTFHHHHSEVKVSKTNQGSISILDAFSNFKIKDFFKECMWITGTAPVITGKTIRFHTINERIDTSKAKDLSSRFVSRDKEIYVYGSYAQKNTFKHKYNGSVTGYADGYLNVNNANLPEETTIAESQIYAPEYNLFIFQSADSSHSFATRKHRIWDIELSKDSEGNLETQYKGLSDRYYILTEQQSPVDVWRFKSTSVSGSTTATVIPYASTELATFGQIVPSVYSKYEDIFNALKVHSLKLAMNVANFVNLDLTKPVYIDRESSYYIVNKISFQEGGISDAEAIKIGKQIVEFSPFTVQVIAVNDGVLRFTFTTSNGFDEMLVDDSYFIIAGEEYQISSYTPPGAFPIIIFEIETTDILNLNSFVIRVTDGTYTQDYIYSGPSVPFTAEDIDNGIIKSLPVVIQQV